MTLFNHIHDNYTVGDMLEYPEKVTISSTGGTSETWPSVLGVYKRTKMTHSGRPVWQSTVRNDRYLFYDGSQKFVLIYNSEM